MIFRMMMKLGSFIFGHVKLFLIKISNIKSFKYSISDRISPFASVSIMHGKIIIGKKCRIDPGSVVGTVNGIVQFGDGCFVNRNCQIVGHEAIIIGKNVMIGPNVVIVDHDHSIKNGVIRKREYITKKITIEDGAWIGSNSVILKGVTIGKNAVIAAGSIVTHDCPAGSTLVQKRVTEIKKGIKP